jgi:hypothetical protein
MNDETKITIDDILKVKEALGEPKVPLSSLRVIENEFLPDDVIVVSKKIYESLKRQTTSPRY